MEGKQPLVMIDPAEIDLAPLIEHTLLNPMAPPQAIAQLCDEADRLNFASVCVYPIHVHQAATLLHRKAPRCVP